MQLKKSLISLLVLGVMPFAVSIATFGQVYYVQPGDSLYSIAARYGASTSQLQSANGLSSSAIHPGQALQINSGAPAADSTSANYTVKPGDRLYLISQRLGVSVATLKQTNHLSSESLNVGQVLTLPSASSGNSSATYKVQSGDTLFLIAQKLGISTAALTQTNNLGSSAKIYPGQVLQVPARTQVSAYNYNNYALSQSDLELLARLVTAESDGEPYTGQVAVAATILNRLRDPRYPKTIPGIIYEIDYGSYQYSPVLDGRINNPASSSGLQAAKDALSGWDPSHGANGFYNPVKTVNQWVRSQTVTANIGNHIFFEY